MALGIWQPQELVKVMGRHTGLVDEPSSLSQLLQDKAVVIDRGKYLETPQGQLLIGIMLNKLDKS